MSPRVDVHCIYRVVMGPRLYLPPSDAEHHDSCHYFTHCTRRRHGVKCSDTILTVAMYHLQAFCKSYSLQTAGKKADLMDRVGEYLDTK